MKKKILFKKPSLKRDDLLSVLDALIYEKVFPGEIYYKLKEKIINLIGLKNILLLPSRWDAWKLVFMILHQKYKVKKILITANSEAYYYYLFKDEKFEISLVDLDRRFIIPDFKNIYTFLNNVDAFFLRFPFGFGVNLEEFGVVDKITLGDFSGNFFTFFNKKHCGSNIDFLIFSFKDEDIVSFGDGALLHVKNDDDYKIIENVIENYNLKLSDYNAALGLSQLSKINLIVNSRKKIFEYYINVISELDKDILDVLTPENYETSNFNNFSILIKDLNILNFFKELLLNERIEYRLIIDKPIYIMMEEKNSYPVVNKLIKNGISLPIYPTLKQEEIFRIGNSLKKINSL